MNQKFYKDANEVYANNRMCLIREPGSDDLLEDYIQPDPESDPVPVLVTDPVKVAKAFYDGQLVIVMFGSEGYHFMTPTSISLVPDGSQTGTGLFCHCEYVTDRGNAYGHRELCIKHNLTDSVAFELMQLAGIPADTLMM